MLAKPELEHFQWQPAVLKRCVLLSQLLAATFLAPLLAMGMATGAFPWCLAARFTLLIGINQHEDDSQHDVWAELCCAALQVSLSRSRPLR